jgi:hypothetical protein
MSNKGSLAVIVGFVTLLSAPIAAWAQDEPELHVGTDYDSCYFDLHSELTADELQQFAAEGGQIVRSRQLSSAETLGRGKLAVSVDYAYFFIDDTKGAWNNTMSHPDADHYLGKELAFPQLTVRYGVSKRVDLELGGSVNWTSNWGFVGVASKIRILEQGGRMPVSVAVRPSVSALLGPSEMQAVNASADVTVSRNIHGFAPFGGVTMSSTIIIENSDDTDVGNQAASRPLAFAGLEYRWKHVNAAAQAELSDLVAFGLRVGGSF